MPWRICVPYFAGKKANGKATGAKTTPHLAHLRDAYPRAGCSVLSSLDFPGHRGSWRKQAATMPRKITGYGGRCHRPVGPGFDTLARRLGVAVPDLGRDTA